MAPDGRVRNWRSNVLLLPAGAAIATLWVNLDGESYYRFTYRLSFAVNDIAMMFYFGLIAKEVVEATAPGGVLHSWRRALLPVIAAVGATVVPALLYVRTVEWLGEPGLKFAWPSSLGIDIAVTYLVARFIFGRTAVPFLCCLRSSLTHSVFSCSAASSTLPAIFTCSELAW
jgi:NhaA family Na+:H+ antiporter